ncbi:putative GDSL-like Lipase/Acylhydrolase superfamily protein [Capsicum annuum]|nr:putative GDSL-like Lipase/Acylhydrolase superfamily protein [Capsicum annuum]
MSGSEEFVYRISTMEEWELLQKTGSTFGGDLDRTTGFIHLSKLDQVQSTLLNFFLNVKDDLYLLQIDAKKARHEINFPVMMRFILLQLGNGLVYEAVDDSKVFPHFYGPSRSFSPLPLDAVIKGEKLVVADGKFVCSMLS